MNAPPDRWEHGSEFHHVAFDPVSAPERAPWSGGLLVGSGRDALRLLAGYGGSHRGWRRLWVPDFLCQEVVAALADSGPRLATYRDDPRAPGPLLPDLTRGDAFLHVNYFGLRAGPSLELPPGVDLVEDHTHDPTSGWAFRSGADFCIASLRKTLPVPDGGALWSPRGHELPAAPGVTEQHAAASAAKLAAMLLKTMYLAGHAVEKDTFRGLAVVGEASIGSERVSGMPDATRALLGSFPLRSWRERRKANHCHLSERLDRLPTVNVLQPLHQGCAPFSVLMVAQDPSARERMRIRLIERRVYPAVLWPLEEPLVPVSDEARVLSRRVLSLHCDMRYGAADLDRVACAVEEASA